MSLYHVNDISERMGPDSQELLSGSLLLDNDNDGQRNLALMIVQWYGGTRVLGGEIVLWL